MISSDTPGWMPCGLRDLDRVRHAGPSWRDRARTWPGDHLCAWASPRASDQTTVLPRPGACRFLTAIHLRSDVKDQFIRYMFHELRVPLNTATMALEELLSTAPSCVCLPPASVDLIYEATIQAGSSGCASI